MALISAGSPRKPGDPPTGYGGGAGNLGHHVPPANVTPNLLPSPDKLSPYGNTDSYGNATTQDTGAYVDENAERMKQLQSWWNDYSKYLKTLYEKEMRNNRQNFESTRNQFNLNKEIVDRRFAGMADPESGRGMAIRARNNSNWMNNVANARNTLMNANDTSTANYNQNLANARSQYMQQYAALMNRM